MNIISFVTGATPDYILASIRCMEADAVHLCEMAGLAADAEDDETVVHELAEALTLWGRAQHMRDLMSVPP